MCYLTAQTWRRGEDSEAFGEECAAAMSLTQEQEVPVFLAHEMPGGKDQEARHGCEFGTFFGHPEGATPRELLKGGIYATIACALKGGEWRKASLVLAGKAIAARLGDDDLAQQA